MKQTKEIVRSIKFLLRKSGKKNTHGWKKKGIQRHASSESHIRNENLAKNTPKIREYIASKSTVNSTTQAARNFEVKLSCFVAEHNLPFAIMDHLNVLLKNSITDSKIVQKFCINRMKAQQIITKVTGPENCKSIIEFCKKKYYSLIVDETTDISVKKFSCFNKIL